MLVNPVQEWTPSAGLYPTPGQSLPKIVLLDLSNDSRACLDFAAHIHGSDPAVRLIACSHVQPGPDLLLRGMRAGIRDFVPKPVTVAAVKESILRLTQEEKPAGGNALATGKVIAVLGTKGGVGTSTVAINVAAQLKQTTQKGVALLDFARPLGDDCLLLDLQPRFSVRDAVESLDRLDGHLLSGLFTRHKSGLDVLAGASNADEWNQIPIPALARVVTLAQSQCEFVVVDLGSFYSSEWKPVLGWAEILLVAEADLPGLYKLERHFSSLRALGIERHQIRIVINRWLPRDDEPLERVKSKLGHFIFMRLPNDFAQVNRAATLGMPLSNRHNDPLGTRLREIALKLAGIAPLSEEKHGLAGLFSKHLTLFGRPSKAGAR